MGIFINKSKDDLYYKFDDWANGSSKVLLITGYSGSGKSTLADKLGAEYGADVIPLDDFIFFLSGRESNKNKYISKFFEKCPDTIEVDDKNYESKRNTKLMEFIKFCGSNSRGKIIIEGLQIYLINPSFVSRYPVIIKNVGYFKSTVLRAGKRTLSADDISGAEKMKQLKHNIKSHAEFKGDVKMLTTLIKELESKTKDK